MHEPRKRAPGSPSPFDRSSGPPPAALALLLLIALVALLITSYRPHDDAPLGLLYRLAMLLVFVGSLVASSRVAIHFGTQIVDKPRLITKHLSD